MKPEAACAVGASRRLRYMKVQVQTSFRVPLIAAALLALLLGACGSPTSSSSSIAARSSASSSASVAAAKSSTSPASSLAAIGHNCAPAGSASAAAPKTQPAPPCRPGTLAPQPVTGCAPIPPAVIPPAIAPATIAWCPTPGLKVGPRPVGGNAVCGHGFGSLERITIVLTGERGSSYWSAVAGPSGAFASPLPSYVCPLLPGQLIARGNKGHVSNPLIASATICRPTL